ncbi:MAG: Bax inhibitor-1 family protein [Lachnospirales bacterium]
MDNFSQINGLGADSIESGLKQHLVKVFGWMFLGLLVTTITALFLNFGILTGQTISYNIVNSYGMLLIFEVIVVFALSFARNKISSFVAGALFFLYAILNGLTIGSIVLAYSYDSITGAFSPVAVQAFGLATLTFGIMAVYGYFTKANLMSLSKYLFVGLIMLLVTTFLNIFVFKSGALDYFITLAGLFLFIGITAWDVQRIKKEYIYYTSSGNSEALKKASILSALSLYLDFINIFLYILRLGSRNN